MTIPIELKSNRSVEYNIYIDKLPKLKFNRKVAIITNPTISKLHLNTLLKNIVADMVYVVTIPDGEEYKILDTVETNLDELILKYNWIESLKLVAFGWREVVGDIRWDFVASYLPEGSGFNPIPN